MFGLMGFAKIGRCWDWCFRSVEYAVVLALRCLSGLVSRLWMESRNVVGFAFAQAESAMVLHLMM